MYSGDIFIDDDGYDDAEEEEEAVGGKNNSAIIIKLSQKCCCKDIMLLPNEPVKLNILQLAKKKIVGKILSPHTKLQFSFRMRRADGVVCGASGFDTLAHGERIWDVRVPCIRCWDCIDSLDFEHNPFE